MFRAGEWRYHMGPWTGNEPEMAKHEKQSKRWALTVMMAMSVVMALSGQGLARRVRGVAPYLLGPLADANMYLATTFRGAISGNATKRLKLTEADQQLLAALVRGEMPEIDGVQQARLQELIDTRAANLARHFHSQANDLARLNRQLANFQGTFGPVADLSCELVPARISAGDSLAYGQTRIVNAGRRNGAAPGDQVTTRLLLTNRAKALEPHGKLAVVTGSALVGRLGETGGYTARLILVTDRSFRTQAQIARVIDPNNPRMIQVENTPGYVTEEALSHQNYAYVPCVASGNGSDAVIVRGVSRGDNIKVGDELVVRIVGTYESTRIPIGKVVEVKVDEKLGVGFDQLRIEPMADLAALREVFILVPTLGILEGGR